MRMDNPEDEYEQVNEPSLSGTYTARDFLSWKTDELMELIRGKIFKMSPGPHLTHQQVSAKLHLSLAARTASPCTLLYAPLDVYLVHPGEDWKATRNILQPDLCLICDPAKLHDRGCIGSPDLVIEILSPSTASKDLGPKRDLYQEYGVKELWIVHPQDETIIIHVLQEGKYEILPILAGGQTLHSPTFPELSFLVDEVFPE